MVPAIDRLLLINYLGVDIQSDIRVSHIDEVLPAASDDVCATIKDEVHGSKPRTS